MVGMLRTTARALFSLVRPETAVFEGQVIPAKRFRFGGAHFARDEDFVRSGEREAKRLEEWCGLSPQSHLLDVGCGPGRLPIGILRTAGEIRSYRGIDVSRVPIAWCRRHLQGRHPSFQFMHIDVRNDRYNPSGARINASFALPFPPGSFDIIYLYSVFSHMETDDVKAYLREFARLLDAQGRVLLTAFIEDDVPPMTVNPPGYRMTWKGALHCVRYERGFFTQLAREQGLQIVRMTHGTETDGQSALLLSREGN